VTQPVPYVRLSPSGRDLGTIGQWNLLHEVDFAAQPSQLLAPDGTYVINGLSWTKANTAGELENTRIVNGTGLIFCPLSGVTRYTALNTAPRLTVPLADMVDDVAILDSEVPLRVMGRFTMNGVPVGNNEVGCGIQYFVGDENFVVGTRSWTAAVAVGGACYERNQSGLITVMALATAVVPAYDVSCVWMPRGVGALGVRFGRAPWIADWPEIPFTAGWEPDNESWDRDSWPGVGFSRNWELVCFAQVATQGAGLEWVVRNVRVEAYF
jgi:hypothetical protein